MQVYLHIHHFPGTWCAPHASSSSALRAEGSLLHVGMIVILQELFVHIADQLLRLTFPPLDHTPPIERGTINDVDIPGDVKSSLFHTQRYS